MLFTSSVNSQSGEKDTPIGYYGDIVPIFAIKQANKALNCMIEI
jgi:hypothetical protein